MSKNLNTFGREVGLLHEVMVTGRKVGADHAFWSRLAHNRLLFERIIQFVNSNKGLGYATEVDYSASPDRLIGAGNYSEVYFILNGQYQFPITRTGKKIVVVELWDEPTLDGDSDEKERVLDELGYRHADIVELLTLAAQYPQVVERNHMVKALGTLSLGMLGGKACAWIGNEGSNDKQGRFLGVCFEERLGCGTYAVVKKTPEDTEVIGEPRMLSFK